MIAVSPTILANELDAENRALEAALAEAEADGRRIPHEDARAWLLALASGDFSAPPPLPR